MDEKQEKVFKTKTGFCHILPDKIILTRDGVIGNMSKALVGNKLTRVFIIYGVLGAGLLFFAYDAVVRGQIVVSIGYGALGGYMILAILSSLNNSATPVIDRKRIKKVVFKKAIKGLTRSRFQIFFEDDKGRTKKRMIMLPGSLSDGEQETAHALRIMRAEELLK